MIHLSNMTVFGFLHSLWTTQHRLNELCEECRDSVIICLCLTIHSWVLLMYLDHNATALLGTVSVAGVASFVIQMFISYYEYLKTCFYFFISKSQPMQHNKLVSQQILQLLKSTFSQILTI